MRLTMTILHHYGSALLGGVLLLTASLSSTMAQAQYISAEKDYSSPQNFLFEIKFGPYSPDIDSAFNTADAPYEHIFGDGKNVMFGGELDVELWRGFGTVAVGGGLGYYSNSAEAFLDDSPDGSTPSTSTTRGGGETSISLVPLSLLAIYRFDLLAEKWRVPLCPFVKLGFNYTFWWINRPDGETAEYGGQKASGGSYGWQFHAGAAFLLDVLEPHAAKNLDVDLGVNHTYLFFEFVHVSADRFGAASALSVGDTTWNGGIAFEF